MKIRYRCATTRQSSLDGRHMIVNARALDACHGTRSGARPRPRLRHGCRAPLSPAFHSEFVIDAGLRLDDMEARTIYNGYAASVHWNHPLDQTHGPDIGLAFRNDGHGLENGTVIPASSRASRPPGSHLPWGLGTSCRQQNPSPTIVVYRSPGSRHGRSVYRVHGRSPGAHYGVPGHAVGVWWSKGSVQRWPVC